MSKHLCNATRRLLPSLGRFSHPGKLGPALAGSTIESSFLRSRGHLTNDVLHSARVPGSLAAFGGLATPLRPKTLDKRTSSSIGTWILAGTVPICYLSLAASATAKERTSLELPKEVVLYQYEACPFCNKLRAYLDYRDIPYKVVEVNPLSKKEIKWSEYKKVPILTVDGEQLNDSSEIITKLEKSLFPDSRKSLGDEENEEDKWRKWVDNHLVHLLAPNIYRTTNESLEAFNYITTHGNFSFFERAAAKYAGAASMYFISKRLKKRHNIENERESLYDAAEEWVKALNGRDFLGGDKPNLADLATFGVLRPIRNLQAGKDMVANTSIGPWYERMEKEVGDSCRLDS